MADHFLRPSESLEKRGVCEADQPEIAADIPVKRVCRQTRNRDVLQLCASDAAVCDKPGNLACRVELVLPRFCVDFVVAPENLVVWLACECVG